MSLQSLDCSRNPPECRAFVLTTVPPGAQSYGGNSADSSCGTASSRGIYSTQPARGRLACSFARRLSTASSRSGSSTARRAGSLREASWPVTSASNASSHSQTPLGVKHEAQDIEVLSRIEQIAVYMRPPEFREKRFASDDRPLNRLPIPASAP